MDDETLEMVRNVFETSSVEEISAFCEDYRMACGYYCRVVDSDHEYCSKLMNRFSNRRS